MAAVKARRRRRRITARMLRIAATKTAAGDPIDLDPHTQTLTVHGRDHRVVAVHHAASGRSRGKPADRPGGQPTTLQLDR